jgi:hypothetical protein
MSRRAAAVSEWGRLGAFFFFLAQLSPPPPGAGRFLFSFVSGFGEREGPGNWREAAFFFFLGLAPRLPGPAWNAEKSSAGRGR